MPKILLTGAGFTHNFGTPLAKQMWLNIFNHHDLNKSRTLRKIMLSRADYDYEKLYFEINNNRIDILNSDRKIFNDVMISVYENLECIIFNTLRTSYPNEQKSEKWMIYLVNFLSLFAREKGCFFTLNQDQFIEKLVSKVTGHSLLMPAIKQPAIFNNNAAQQNIYNLDELDIYEWFKEYATNDTINENLLQNSIVPSYIKLHGSSDWINNQNDPLMVIGRGKEIQIANNPLLTKYFDIFNNVLQRPNTQLMVIGYSFSDNHINEIISQAIKNYDLKIHVISPQPIDSFRKSLEFTDIDNALDGYYQYHLKDILGGYSEFDECSKNTLPQSVAWTEIYNNFFKNTDAAGKTKSSQQPMNLATEIS